ncbi:unnamed protein product [Orchesella dallaii]|uniref:Histone deacetylase interacting domain-containing protein n=1 Tax=Orchesella dallaii TaxID=48710 RepID=A0ABP1RRX0_9HEXA
MHFKMNNANNAEVHLRVEDAVTYLEHVKQRYHQRPQTYNDFLDIMKDFKSQSLDTPGVIDRVAHLFQGDPDMIMGFNMFLPPEYRVVVNYSNDPYSAGRLAGLVGSPFSGGAKYTVSTVHNPSLAGPIAVSTGPHVAGYHHQFQMSHHVSQAQSNGDHFIFKHPLMPPNLTSVNVSMDGRQALRFSSPSNCQPSPNTMMGAGSPYSIIGGGSSYSTQTEQVQVGVAKLQLLNGGVVKGDNEPPGGTSAVAVTSSASTSGTSVVASSSAPTMKANERSSDFDFAVAYVNRVKSAFASKPGKYEEFLEVITAYQNLKTSQSQPPSTGASGGTPTKSVDEMFKQVKKLFKGHNDLLEDFRVFILEQVPTLCRAKPKAGKGKGAKTAASVKRTKPKQTSAGADSQSKDQPKKRNYRRKQTNPKPPMNSSSTSATQTSQISSPSPLPEPKPIECIPKRHFIRPSPSSSSSSKTNGDMNETGAGAESASEEQRKKMTREEFLEKIRNFLTPCSEAYDIFVLLINMYNHKKILGSECLQLITPILAPAPDLLTWFKKFVRRGDKKVTLSGTPTPAKESAMDKPQETDECIMDIDYSSCRRYGVNYCVVPEQMQRASQDSFLHPNDPISTLNNVYVSMPNWPDNIRYVPPRRTQLETCQNRIEDERFEMDMVIESNFRTIEYFQQVEKQMSLMSPAARENFTLDESLGGTPSFLNERSVRRIYGNGEKADDIIRGLKENPAVAIPRVLNQLQKKHLEWSDVRRDSQNHWRDELDILQLKVLEQKANQFKQADLKSFKFKTLVSEIASVYNKREKAKKTGDETAPADGFHLTLHYQNKLMIHEACELLLYYVRRVPDIELDDKKIINTLMKHFIPGLLGHPDLEIMSDEDSDVEEVESGPTSLSSQSKAVSSSQNRDAKNRRTLRRIKLSGEKSTTVKCQKDGIQMKEGLYRLFFGNSIWYAFFRLHHILCERLSQIYELGKGNLSEDDLLGGTVTGQLGYKPEPIEDPIECYLRVIDLVKDLINNGLDSDEYEERLREIFGSRAYIAFSMDKLIEAAVMQLMSLRDDNWPPFVDIYYQFNEKKLSGQKKDDEELKYLLEAKALISGKNSLFKVAVFDKDLTEMKVELIPLSADAELGQNKRCNDRKKPEYYKIDESITVPSGNPRHSTYFYRRGAMHKARKVHKKITLIKLKKFNRWHSRWLCNNTSEDDPKNCESWLKEAKHAAYAIEPDDNSMKLVVDPCCWLEKPPYHEFQHYRIRGMKWE